MCHPCVCVLDAGTHATCLASSWPLVRRVVRKVLAGHEMLRFFPEEIEGHEEHQLLSIFCRVESVLPCRPRSLPIWQDPVSWLAALSMLGWPASPEPQESRSVCRDQPWGGVPSPAGSRLASSLSFLCVGSRSTFAEHLTSSHA